MRKQELIDAAEASGLSRVPIAYVDWLYQSAEFCLLVLLIT